jgi:hypothetical protein
LLPNFSDKIKLSFPDQRVRYFIEYVVPGLPLEHTLSRQIMEEQEFRHDGGLMMFGEKFRRQRVDLAEDDVCLRESRPHLMEETNDGLGIST